MGSAVSVWVATLLSTFRALPGESERLEPAGRSSPEWFCPEPPHPQESQVCLGVLRCVHVCRPSPGPGVPGPSCTAVRVAQCGDMASPTLPPLGQHLFCPPTCATRLTSSAFSSQEPSRSPYSGPSLPQAFSTLLRRILRFLLVWDRWRGGPGAGAFIIVAGVRMHYT